MATASKKTTASTKVAADAPAKKTVARKVITETKTSPKATVATAAKKTVAKTPTAKSSVKKSASAEAIPAKIPVVKKAAAIKTAVSISPEHRYHMIATAAYYLAERRGFAGGYEMQDWISAEAEIDAQLSD